MGRQHIQEVRDVGSAKGGSNRLPTSETSTLTRILRHNSLGAVLAERTASFMESEGKEVRRAWVCNLVGRAFSWDMGSHWSKDYFCFLSNGSLMQNSLAVLWVWARTQEPPQPLGYSHASSCAFSLSGTEFSTLAQVQQESWWVSRCPPSQPIAWWAGESPGRCWNFLLLKRAYRSESPTSCASTLTTRAFCNT